jgi:hypothetical protein
LSCWTILPGSRPVAWICTQRPTPSRIRQSLSVAAWSAVQPGEGVKFHLGDLRLWGVYERVCVSTGRA